MSKPAILDHLIHLVPNLETSITLYSSLGFQVQRGGQHADGLTENALIVLPDGIYIELIAFINDDNDATRKHWWYGRAIGWIDWCLLGLPSASLGDIYETPQRGGRKTLSGEEIAWRVTFPTNEYLRGTVPFYCEDSTPRESRVPPRDVHHNGVQGVSALKLLFSTERVGQMVSLYKGIFGECTQEDSINAFAWNWIIGTPNGTHVTVTIKAAQDPQEVKWIQDVGEGLFEVELRAPPDGIERTTCDAGYGRLRFHPGQVRGVHQV